MKLEVELGTYTSGFAYSHIYLRVRPAMSLLNAASAKKNITTTKFRVQQSDRSVASFANSGCDIRLRLPCQKKTGLDLFFFS